MKKEKMGSKNKRKRQQGHFRRAFDSLSRNGNGKSALYIPRILRLVGYPMLNIYRSIDNKI